MLNAQFIFSLRDSKCSPKYALIRLSKMYFLENEYLKFEIMTVLSI